MAAMSSDEGAARDSREDADDLQVEDPPILAAEDPLDSEGAVLRRLRIRALFDKLDHARLGFLNAENIGRSLSEIAYAAGAEPLLPPASGPSPSQEAVATASNTRTSTPALSAASISGLENIPIGSINMYARELVKVCDTTADGRITFAEFEGFVHRKERELLELFQQIDSGNDNVIHLDKLLSSVRAAGIEVSESELQQFIETVDKDNDGVIDFFEWRDYLLLLPQKTTLKNVFTFFNTVVSNVDFNSDAVAIPDAISPSGFMLRLKYFLAGGIAGAVSRTVTAPLDRIKVLLQTQTLQTHVSYWTLISSAIKKIYSDGGIPSFYRGNGLNILKIFPESALKFFVFEYSKDMIRKYNAASDGRESLGLGGRFLAGGVAGLVSQFVIYPIETTKTHVMAQITNGAAHKLERLASGGYFPPKNAPVIDTVRHLWAQGGIRVFYRGCGPALVGIVPYAGIDLAVFETLKHSYLGWASNDSVPLPSLNTPLILAFGMISGTCGAVLVYPLSLIRTRLQAQGTPSHPTFYTSTFDVIHKTYLREGVVGFYKGLAPTLLKVLPAVSISYWAYEKTKLTMNIP